MHSCPDCGQACYCSGDIDDCLMDTDETYEACEHECGSGMDEEADGYLDDCPDVLGLPGHEEGP